MKRTRKQSAPKQSQLPSQSPSQPFPQSSSQSPSQPSSSSSRDLWINFLISVLGTAIGVGLTFIVSNLVENRNKAEAQRITAMMVIDDIDQSLEILSNIQNDEEQHYQATLYVMDRLPDIDGIAIDTLVMVFNYLVENSSVSSEIQFSQAGENAFQGNQDAWMNLHDMSFIRNVDDFYKSRTMLTNAISSFYYWRKPVDKTESYELLSNSDVLSSVSSYTAFLREQLQSQRTLRFLRNYDGRMQTYTNIIQQWKYLSEENKALMHITNEDMEQFRQATE